MPIERTAPAANLIDVLDRVLDKGVVIDAWLRVSVVGIELVTIEARVVVASLATYLQYSDVVGQASMPSPPSMSGLERPATSGDAPAPVRHHPGRA
jgi:gas vesicle structural protein